MIKPIFFILLFTVISCGKSEDDKSSSFNPLSPSGYVLTLNPETGIPYEAENFQTALTLLNFNLSQEEKVMAAAELVKRVVASKEFRDGIINHTYNGKRTFIDNGGLSNEEIYQKILEGAETFYHAYNYTLDVKLELYFQDSNVVGYTYPSTDIVWMNTKYFNSYTPAQVSGNLMHEWLHKLGFTHSYNYTTNRAFSVPYAVGYLMTRLAKTHL